VFLRSGLVQCGDAESAFEVTVPGSGLGGLDPAGGFELFGRSSVLVELFWPPRREHSGAHFRIVTARRLRPSTRLSTDTWS